MTSTITACTTFLPFSVPRSLAHRQLTTCKPNARPVCFGLGRSVGRSVGRPVNYPATYCSPAMGRTRTGQEIRISSPHKRCCGGGKSENEKSKKQVKVEWNLKTGRQSARQSSGADKGPVLTVMTGVCLRTSERIIANEVLGMEF